jgi:hypothetical protein
VSAFPPDGVGIFTSPRSRGNPQTDLIQIGGRWTSRFAGDGIDTQVADLKLVNRHSSEFEAPA